MLANNVLNQFKQYPDAWLVVDRILSTAQNPNTKFFALQILDEAVWVSSLIKMKNDLDQVASASRGVETRNPQLHHQPGAADLGG